MKSITFQDFKPVNRWTDENGAETWNNHSTPNALVDQSTGRHYHYQSKTWIRIKCALLTIGVPLLHPLISLGNIAFRIFKLISGFHFWYNVKSGKKYSATKRCKKACWDLLRIAATPLALTGLMFSTLYGVIRPNDGRKLYASFERALYERAIMAPCFQPDL